MNILITRPLSQVQHLTSLVQKAGFQPILFPVLEVGALQNKAKKSHYDVIIFISANAVDYAMPVLEQIEHDSSLVCAVGSSTAKRLQHWGMTADVFPKDKASSEALLAMPEVYKLNNQDILIFRGKGGRETLKLGLEKLNNRVEYIEVYERVTPETTPQHHQSLATTLHESAVITITSIQSLKSMLYLAEKIDDSAAQLLKKMPIVVLSSRIGDFAISVGFSQVIVSKTTDDLGIVGAIKQIKTSKN